MGVASFAMAVSLKPSATLPHRGRPSRAAAASGRALLTILVALLGVVAGVGWLYLIRNSGRLGSGPNVSGALPLQQLAGNATQPLVRMLAAWIPVGLATGWALGRLVGVSRAPRAVTVALLALLALGAAGAASDAIAVNQRFSDHVSHQLSSPGIWIAALLLTAAAVVAPTRPRARMIVQPPDGGLLMTASTPRRGS